MKKDICINPRSGRAKIVSDKLVTCTCDVVKKDCMQTFRELYNPRITM